MRRIIALTLFLPCFGCTLVTEQRIQPYEGACSNEEEAAKASYDDQGRATPAGGRSVRAIAKECAACATTDCIEDCVRERTGFVVSFECASCFANAVYCIGADCLGELNACSGLDLTTNP